MSGRICIAIACAGLLATSAASARAQTTFRETGSVTVGGYIVWVRGTSANAVELFVGRGFRDAFAHAHEMDAAKLQHWIDSVRAIAPLPPDDSSAVDAHVAGSPVGDGVTMIRRVGGPFSGLRLIVTGEEPITMAEPTARDFLAVLDSATHAARALSPQPMVATTVETTIAPATVETTAVTTAVTTAATTALADPAPPATPSNPPVVATIAKIAVDTSVVVAAPVPVKAEASVVVAVASAPVKIEPPPVVAAAPVVPTPVTPGSASVVALGPSSAEATPELVLPPPKEPVILLASRVDIMPRPLPIVVAAPVAALAAAPVPAPAPVAAPAPAVAAVAEAPDRVVVAPAPVPRADTAVPRPAAPADKLIHTPLGPFTIPGALLADRDKEAQYCYTQLGLKYSPDLKGEITVKVLVNSDGAVQEAVVTKRSWQGISAGEVESCVRALAHDWTFAPSDPSIADGGKLLTFSFAP